MGISLNVMEEPLPLFDPDIEALAISSLKETVDELMKLLVAIRSIDDESIICIERGCYKDRPKRHSRVYHTPCNSHAESYIEGNHRECQTTKKISQKCNKMMTNATKRPTINRQKRQLYGSPVKSYKSKK